MLSASRPQLPGFTPQALANSIWSLARLGSPPDPRWMAAFIEETFLKLGLFNAQVWRCGGVEVFLQTAEASLY